MKHKGNKFEHEQQRNYELVKAYRNALGRAFGRIRLDEILVNTVNTPASRFWVSAERAMVVVARMYKGDTLEDMRPSKQEMFKEIFQRVVRLREQMPDTPLLHIVEMAVTQPAPKFYLTPQSAKVIICRIRRKKHR